MNVEFTLPELEKIKAGLLVAGSIVDGPAITLVNAKIAMINRDTNLVKSTWDAYCVHYGLKPEDFGRTFKFRSRTYEITSLNPQAPSFPINARRLPDGKQFRFPIAAVR